MPAVVSDTSVINYLAALGQAELFTAKEFNAKTPRCRDAKMKMICFAPLRLCIEMIE